jgi:hypothetical protein
MNFGQILDKVDSFLSSPIISLLTIVVEVGYTEKYEDLLEDASLLLEGSSGRIECVLLIKLSQPEMLRR